MSLKSWSYIRSLIPVLIALATVFSLSCGGAATEPAASSDTATEAPSATMDKMDATAAPEAADTPVPEANTGKYGGIISHVLLAEDPASIDVHAESPASHMWSVVGVYDNLVRWDPEFGGDPGRQIIGDLAESWDVENNGERYVFHLHDNVVWDDGQPFSSADVKASLDRMLDPDFRSPRGGGLLKPIVTSVSTPDANTVIVDLKFATPLLLPSIGSDWVKIIRKDILDREDPDLSNPENIHGTGPFVFKKLTRGLGYTLEKSPTYRDERYPYLDGVNSIFSKEMSTILAAFITKKIHAHLRSPNPKPEQIDQVRNRIGVENLIDPPPVAICCPAVTYLNTRIPPFDDVRARTAVWLALNRQEISDKAFGGPKPGEIPGAILSRALFGDFALPDEEVLATPGLRLVDGKKHPDDIAEARRLWAEAVPEGLETNCTVRDTPSFQDVQQVVSRQLEEVLGIKCPVGSETMGPTLARGGAADFVIHLFYTANTIPDPSEFFSLLWKDDGGRNWSGWSHPEFEELWTQQVTETDPEKRKQMLYRMQRILIDPANGNPVIPTAKIANDHLVWSCVNNWHVGPDIYDDKRLDRVWLGEGCK